jgi:hypothetical protein
VFTNSVVQAAQSAARRLGLETTVINATTDTELV